MQVVSGEKSESMLLYPSITWIQGMNSTSNRIKALGTFDLSRLQSYVCRMTAASIFDEPKFIPYVSTMKFF